MVRGAVVALWVVLALACERDPRSGAVEQTRRSGDPEASAAPEPLRALATVLCSQRLRRAPRLELLQAAVPTEIPGWRRQSVDHDLDAIGQPTFASAIFVKNDGSREAEFKIEAAGPWVEYRVFLGVAAFFLPPVQPVRFPDACGAWADYRPAGLGPSDDDPRPSAFLMMPESDDPYLTIWVGIRGAEGVQQAIDMASAYSLGRLSHVLLEAGE